MEEEEKAKAEAEAKKKGKRVTIRPEDIPPESPKPKKKKKKGKKKKKVVEIIPPVPMPINENFANLPSLLNDKKFAANGPSTCTVAEKKQLFEDTNTLAAIFSNVSPQH